LDVFVVSVALDEIGLTDKCLGPLIGSRPQRSSLERSASTWRSLRHARCLSLLSPLSLSLLTPSLSVSPLTAHLRRRTASGVRSPVRSATATTTRPTATPPPPRVRASSAPRPVGYDRERERKREREKKKE
jgi:hypothetical protein